MRKFPGRARKGATHLGLPVSVKRLGTVLGSGSQGHANDPLWVMVPASGSMHRPPARPLTPPLTRWASGLLLGRNTGVLHRTHLGVMVPASGSTPRPARMRSVTSCAVRPWLSMVVTEGSVARLASSCDSVSSEQNGSTWGKGRSRGGRGGGGEVLTVLQYSGRRVTSEGTHRSAGHSAAFVQKRMAAPGQRGQRARAMCLVPCPCVSIHAMSTHTGTILVRCTLPTGRGPTGKPSGPRHAPAPGTPPAAGPHLHQPPSRAAHVALPVQRHAQAQSRVGLLAVNLAGRCGWGEGV